MVSEPTDLPASPDDNPGSGPAGNAGGGEPPQSPARSPERHPRFSGLGILMGGLAATGGMVVAGPAWQSGQQLGAGRSEVGHAQEGPVTDRYTQAARQLGSADRDARTAAVYAMERVAADYEGHRRAVRDALAAFVGEHDPAPDVKDAELPTEPDADVQAALTVLGRRIADPADTPRLDLHAIRAHGCRLTNADLTGADLTDSDLADADLRGADLTDADLRDADLTDADLRGADLLGADLLGVNLRGADLRGADLLNANLRDADLTGVDLIGARWSTGTSWPKSVGGVRRMRARSDPFEGVYRVR